MTRTRLLLTLAALALIFAGTSQAQRHIPKLVLAPTAPTQSTYIASSLYATISAYGLTPGDEYQGVFMFTEPDQEYSYDHSQSMNVSKLGAVLFYLPFEDLIIPGEPPGDGSLEMKIVSPVGTIFSEPIVTDHGPACVVYSIPGAEQRPCQDVPL